MDHLELRLIGERAECDETVQVPTRAEVHPKHSLSTLFSLTQCSFSLSSSHFSLTPDTPRKMDLTIIYTSHTMYLTIRSTLSHDGFDNHIYISQDILDNKIYVSHDGFKIGSKGITIAQCSHCHSLIDFMTNFLFFNFTTDS